MKNPKKKVGGGGGAYNPNLEAYDPNSPAFNVPVSTSYLTTHPWYPNHDTLTCVNSIDGGSSSSPPEFMTWEGGYAESHLFTTKDLCCERWFPDLVHGCATNAHVDGLNATSISLEMEVTVQNYCGVTWAEANDNCLTPCPDCIAGVACDACGNDGEQCFTYVSSCPSMTLKKVEEETEDGTYKDNDGGDEIVELEQKKEEGSHPWYVNWEIGACINDGNQSEWEKEEDLFRFKEECCAYKFEYKFDTCLGGDRTATADVDNSVSNATAATPADDVATGEGGDNTTFVTSALYNNDLNVLGGENNDDNYVAVEDVGDNVDNNRAATTTNADPLVIEYDRWNYDGVTVDNVANWDDNGGEDDEVVSLPMSEVVKDETATTTMEEGCLTPPCGDEEELVNTFPTYSCGSDMMDARSCTTLCLSGHDCPDGLSCFPDIMCPSSIVSTAMGDAGILIKDHVDPSETMKDGTNLMSVCGTTYEDAERKCRAGRGSPPLIDPTTLNDDGVIPSESSLGMYGFADDFLACDEGGNCPLSSGQTCYSGIVCPLFPTMVPTTDVPTLTLPPVNVDRDIPNDGDDDGEKITESGPVLSSSVAEGYVRADKTRIVGAPPPTLSRLPPAPLSSSSNGASPYTLDKSTPSSISEGMMPVASTTCTGGCPQDSTCVGSSSTGQLVKDEECTPCTTGQTWWPCDVDGACWCWTDGTDRIAPAPGSDVENEVAKVYPQYTVCDDILTREVFTVIAPDAKEPYTYEGLCDAMLAYNSKHMEMVFGMGNLYQRTAELAAFLGNTLHESDELRAGREYLMCADNVVVDGEVFCKPCDTGSFDWELKVCNHGLVTGTSEFNEYCQPESEPPEACPCGNGVGESDREGYVAAKHLFFGRGSIQLSWNYNYIGASVALTGSAETFCDNPDLVATEGRYAWGAGIYFWMEHSKEGTTCHIEALKDGGDFGGTLNNINGGLECPSAAGGWHHDAVKARLNRYCRAAKALGLPNLMPFEKCAGLQESFDSCLLGSTCEDCQHFVGSTPGEIDPNFVPPAGPAPTTAKTTPNDLSDPESSQCPDGLWPWKENPDCCIPNPNFIGDGACDPDAPYNIEACDFDGGDCCKGTCKKDSAFSCTVKEGDELAEYGPFGFYCVDPSRKEAVINSRLCITDEKYRIGDGKCDSMFNTQECNYDGGDCCEDSCSEIFSFFPCGSGGVKYNCIDPRYKADPLNSEDVKADLPKPVDNNLVDDTDDLSNPFSVVSKATDDTSTPPPPRPARDETVCRLEKKECPGGEFVGRNPKNRCNFDPCNLTSATTTTVATSAKTTATTTAATASSITTASTPTGSPKACKKTLKECQGGEFVEQDPSNNCKYFPCAEIAEFTVAEPSKSSLASFVASTEDKTNEEKPKESSLAQIETSRKCERDLLECSDGTFVKRNPKNHCKFLECPLAEDEELAGSLAASINSYAAQHEKEDAPMLSMAESINSYAAQFPSISHKKCATDVLECSDSSFVQRDPHNDCKFAECPDSKKEDHVVSFSSSSAAKAASFSARGHHGHCTDELRRCSDGSFVSRDPDNKCKWFGCPTGESSMKTLSGPGSVHENLAKSSERPADHLKQNNEDQEKKGKQIDHETDLPCEIDLFTCHGGSFVGRDFDNGCKFFKCPNDDLRMKVMHTMEEVHVHDKDSFGN